MRQVIYFLEVGNALRKLPKGMQQKHSSGALTSEAELGTDGIY